MLENTARAVADGIAVYPEEVTPSLLNSASARSAAPLVYAAWPLTNLRIRWRHRLRQDLLCLQPRQHFRFGNALITWC